MSAPARRTTTWSTTDGIKAVILERGLHPGDLMPTELELCQDLGVSRSSVREAIRTLASLDIVDVRHGHGTYVGAMSLAPLVNGMVFRLSLDADRTLKPLSEVVATRIALDRSVAEELADLHRGRHDERLHGYVEAMRRRRARGENFMEEDRAFHERLLRDLDNGIVRQLAGAFWEIHMAALPLLGVSSPEDISDTVEAHGAMLAALEAGDAEIFKTAIDAHYAPLLRAIARAGLIPREHRLESAAAE